MKKRKFSLLLNIATIALCVCAIAIGVYSAKQASLTVSGSIGFNAHNINYAATVKMYGHSGSTDEKPVAETSAVELTRNSGTYAILTGTKFSDLGASGNPETIYIKVEVTNNSDYPISVSTDLASSTCGTHLQISSDQNTSAVILADKNATNTSTKTGSVIFKVDVKANADGTYPEITTAETVNIKVNLAKSSLTAGTSVRADIPAEIKDFTKEYKESVRASLLSDVSDSNILSYAERYPYYIEMGGVTGQEKVKWLIVGTMSESTNTTEQPSLKKLGADSNNAKALSEGLMLNKTYSLLSEKVLYSESQSNYGISFQNKYTHLSDSPYLNDYGYEPTDYATSNIRKYLNGETVKRSYKYTPDGATYYNYTGTVPDGADVTLYTTYNLTTDPVFNKIKGRSLSGLYNEPYNYSSHLSEMMTVPTLKSGYTTVSFSDTTEDKFWLLSATEIQELFGDDLSSISFSSENYFYRSSTAYKYTTTSATGWWLRSIYLGQADGTCMVDTSGFMGFYYDNLDDKGTRPAFLI